MDTEIRINGRHSKEISTDATTFYRSYWEKGEKISEDTQCRNRFILENFFKNGIKGSRILELGVGGEGGILYPLKEHNEVHGIDVSVSAKENCARLGIDIINQHLDFEKLWFDRNYFDAIFAFEVFEHFTNPQFVIEECRRVLKADGIMLIVTPRCTVHTLQTETSGERH